MSANKTAAQNKASARRKRRGRCDHCHRQLAPDGWCPDCARDVREFGGWTDLRNGSARRATPYAE